jgi:hypothetical protein
MTKRAIATQAQVRRNILAAQKVGLNIVGIKPDGTVLVRTEPHLPVLSLDEQLSDAKWKEVEV